MFGGKPQVEVNFHPIGDDVISANSAMDIGYLKARWLKRLIAVVPMGFREPKSTGRASWIGLRARCG